MIKNLTTPISTLLEQISKLLHELPDETYSMPLPVLSGASLGQHTRHVIEFYFELAESYTSGMLSYDARKRDPRIECSRVFANACIATILSTLEKPDKPLLITGDYGTGTTDLFTIPTNYQRELMYNLEHTVHHMALLRIGIASISAIVLPDHFGVAVSTVKYRAACAR